MVKKQIRLTKEVTRKSQSYIPGGLDELIREVKENRENIVRINFEVSEGLRNAFKAKAAHHGKKVKDILTSFMTDYIKNGK